MALDLPSQCPTPLLVIFSMPESFALSMRQELEGVGFAVEMVKDHLALVSHLSSPRCFGVIVGDNGVFDPLQILQKCRSLGPARWIIFSRQSEKTTFRARAFSLGAASVQPFPPVPGVVAAESRRLFAEQKESFVLRMGLQISPDPFERFRALPSLPGDPDYQRRRKWPLFSERTERQSLGRTSMGQIWGFDRFLQQLQHEMQEQQVRFRLVSFGVDGPLLGADPSKFVVLSSNQSLYPHELITPVSLYPEVMGALSKKEAVYVTGLGEQNLFAEHAERIEKALVRDVAAIPLFLSDRIFAMFLLRFSGEASPRRIDFLRDFTAYARELTPLVANLDFFSRIYRSNPLILPTKQSLVADLRKGL